MANRRAPLPPVPHALMVGWLFGQTIILLAVLAFAIMGLPPYPGGALLLTVLGLAGFVVGVLLATQWPPKPKRGQGQ